MTPAWRKRLDRLVLTALLAGWYVKYLLFPLPPR